MSDSCSTSYSYTTSSLIDGCILQDKDQPIVNILKRKIWFNSCSCLSIIPAAGTVNLHLTELMHGTDGHSGRYGGLMVSALDSRLNGPGSSPGHKSLPCVLGKTIYSHSASLHPGV